MTEPGEPRSQEWSLGRLLSMAARLVEQDWNEWLASRDLTHAGLLVLHLLDAGPRSQRELAAASVVEEQTIGRVLARLERTGYIARERDPADQRRILVSRTPSGSQALRAALRADVANTLVSAHLPDADSFRRDLLLLITARLADRGEPVPAELGRELADDAGRP
jgi:MarR family transcriptional regulator, organic hydroperoxide resistance regulator